MNKPRKAARPLGDVARRLLADSFRKQGFASSELVLRWAAVAGEDIAQCAEPLKMQWPRAVEGEAPQPATLVLRVEGPAAIEVQHLSAVILERVNRYFGWAAVGRIAIRQAPLRKPRKRPRRAPDPLAIQQVADGLPDADPQLKAALARLGAAVKTR